MGWLSNIGFLPASRDFKEAGTKKKIHHFWRKICAKNLVGGEMGDRSLFYQEEPCRLLGNLSEPCKPSSHLQHILKHRFQFTSPQERSNGCWRDDPVLQSPEEGLPPPQRQHRRGQHRRGQRQRQGARWDWMSNCAVFKGFLKDLEWEFRCPRSVPALNERSKMQSSSFNPF